MGAVMDRPRTRQESLFDHKLTAEELEEVLSNWDYDPDYYDDDDDDCDTPAPVWDMYGNPTRETLDAMYESRHGIGLVMTAGEAIEEIHEACS